MNTSDNFGFDSAADVPYCEICNDQGCVQCDDNSNPLDPSSGSTLGDVLAPAMERARQAAQTATDMKDFEDRQDLQSRVERREQRLELDLLTQAYAHNFGELIHIFGGYPGKDGTEWTARLMASSQLSTMQWKITDLETKQLPKAMQALEAAIVSEGVPTQLDDEWDEATGRYVTPDAAYASMMPESKVERCEAWVLGLEEQYDCLQAAWAAAIPVFEETFGKYVKATAKNKAITAADNPRLAAMKERMSRKMKPARD
jgi:hypothetical protein